MAEKKFQEESEQRDSFKFIIEDGIDFKNRIIHLTGTVGEDFDFNFVEGAMTSLESSSRKTITLKLNSTGGAVYEALAIVGRIQSSPCRIIIEAYGAVMSAATLILVSGHKRRISEYCTVMHHSASYYIGGTHDSVKEEVEQFEREENLWSEWMEKFTKISAENWRKMAHKKNKYMTAQEAFEAGMADEVF